MGLPAPGGRSKSKTTVVLAVLTVIFDRNTHDNRYSHLVSPRYNAVVVERPIVSCFQRACRSNINKPNPDTLSTSPNDGSRESDHQTNDCIAIWRYTEEWIEVVVSDCRRERTQWIGCSIHCRYTYSTIHHPDLPYSISVRLTFFPDSRMCFVTRHGHHQSSPGRRRFVVTESRIRWYVRQNQTHHLFVQSGYAVNASSDLPHRSRVRGGVQCGWGNQPICWQSRSHNTTVLTTTTTISGIVSETFHLVAWVRVRVSFRYHSTNYHYRFSNITTSSCLS